MKTSVIDHAEKLKQNISIVSDNSKKNIRTMIGSASKEFEAALNLNKKLIESLEKQIYNGDFANISLISEVKKTFGNSVELSEEAIDYIIDIYNDQLQSNIDINMELMKTIKNQYFEDKEAEEELMQVIEKNFEKITNQLNENTKKVTDIYNKHINLSINFNKKFSENINSQLKMLNGFQNRNQDSFTEWWKSAKEEVEAF
ncbi:MAG: hypothetical protein HYU68_02040 [Bacteroidetes bacterium]|nr:hypothetical protein [Bacteroidota bacterium]